MRPPPQEPERLERPETGLLRSRQFVAAAIADEPGVRRIDAEAAERFLVNPGVRLRQADLAREHRVIDTRREGGLRPRRDVFGETVADDPEEDVRAPKLVEHGEHRGLDLGE